MFIVQDNCLQLLNAFVYSCICVLSSQSLTTHPTMTYPLSCLCYMTKAWPFHGTMCSYFFLLTAALFTPSPSELCGRQYC